MSDPPPQMIGEPMPDVEGSPEKSRDGEKAEPRFFGMKFKYFACLLCCLCVFGTFGGIVGIIFAFVVKARISPGVPETCYTMPEIPDGYPAIETYDVTTEDGVTLELWRMRQTDSSRPVLVMHGLECSSRDWFTGLDTQCLPYMLWDSGFDVWVGNNRGNFYTTTNTWNWTFVEMADFDVKAMVNAIISETGAASMAWIGHSQGATQAFMHFSEDSETASKIAYFGALSPAIFMTQTVLVWNVFSTLHVDDIVAIASARPGTPFLAFEEMQRDGCWTTAWTDDLCASQCGQAMGGTYMQGTDGWMPGCLDKFRCIPAGTSSDNIRAFADCLRAGSFQTYLEDLGRPINFTNLDMPIGLSVGASDLFMTPQNVQEIGQRCRTGIVEDFWELPGAGHMDLVWGTDAPDLVYQPLIAKLNVHLPR